MANRTVGNVSSHRLTHIAEDLKKRGGGDSAVYQALEMAGLTRNDLNRKDHSIDGQKEARFLQAAVEIVGDLSFAAQCGLNFNKNTAITAYVAKYSENLQQAVVNAQKYSVLVDSNSRYQLRNSGNAVSFTIKNRDPILRLDPRHCEFSVFAIITIMRSVTDQVFNPLEIRFRHFASEAKLAISRMINCPIVYGTEDTEIILTPSTLELSVPTYDPSLLYYLKDYGDGLLSRLNQPSPDLQALIEDLLVKNLPARLLTATEIAEKLGMTQRTMARKLSDKDFSYSSIVDELRYKLASQYLRQSETPLSEIAFLLDFAEQASFSTAFKRWSGMTPTAFRKKSALV